MATRCFLCGIKVSNDNFDYLDDQVIHRNQVCPVIDPTLRSLIRTIIFSGPEEARKAVQQIEKNLRNVEDEHSVTCKYCGQIFNTTVRGNTARCTHCSKSQYVRKG